MSEMDYSMFLKLTAIYIRISLLGVVSGFIR